MALEWWKPLALGTRTAAGRARPGPATAAELLRWGGREDARSDEPAAAREGRAAAPDGPALRTPRAATEREVCVQGGAPTPRPCPGGGQA